MEAGKDRFRWLAFLGGVVIGVLAARALLKLAPFVAPGITKSELASATTIAFSAVLTMAVSRAFRARAARKKETELAQSER